MEICKSRGAFINHMGRLVTTLNDKVFCVFKRVKGGATFFAKKTQEITTASMPSAILPNLACVLVCEWVGSFFSEKVAMSALDTTINLIDTYSPVRYETVLPLFLTLAWEEILYRQDNISKQVQPILAMGGALLFSGNKVDTIARFVISISANIGGGYLGLQLAGAPIDFRRYRKGMLRHNIAGWGFNLIIVPSQCAILQAVRKTTCVFLQSVAYNPSPFINLVKIIAKRDSGNVNIFCATLMQFLSDKIGQIRVKQILDNITQNISPFFLKSGRSSFSLSGAIASEMDPKLRQLQDNSFYLANAITRALIDYQSLINDPIVILKTEELLRACLKTDNRTEINDIQKSLSQFLSSSLSGNRSYSSKIIQLAGSQLIWTEDNLIELSKGISNLVEKVSYDILGVSVYKEKHLDFIKIIIHLHIKYYIQLLLSQLTLKLETKALSPGEEIQLFEVGFSLLKVILFPVLPNFLTKKVVSRAESDIINDYFVIGALGSE
jgi:hypothetical protein